MIDATLSLFAQGGLDGVSIRAVAATVGVSPMTTYRYFTDKTDLLGGLWHHTFVGLFVRLEAALATVVGAAARHRALIDAFLAYWEEHPDLYRLVYGADDRRTRSDANQRGVPEPIYADLLELGKRVTKDLCVAVGGNPAQIRLASDIRLAMMLGYLASRFVTPRYPWVEAEAFRPAYVEQIDLAIQRRLLADMPA